MKAASINELKQELTELPSKKVLELCLRLARYKKENKELLTYLLFEAHDEQGFIASVKKEIDEQFETLPKANYYFIKKGLRKILRSITKHSKHTGTKESAAEMLIYFCEKLKTSGIAIHKNQALTNLYKQQIKKLHSLAEQVHEDLRFDYKKQIEVLED
jgi:hypothetical protein